MKLRAFALSALLPFVHASSSLAAQEQNDPAKPSLHPLPVPPTGETLDVNDLPRPPRGFRTPQLEQVTPETQIGQAICAAIEQIRAFGEAQAADELEKSKQAGKIWTLDKLTPKGKGLASTSPDGVWFPDAPDKQRKEPLFTPNRGNHYLLEEGDFRIPTTPPGAEEDPAQYRYGTKGLAIVLLHEWKHGKQQFVPWKDGLHEGSYNRDKLVKRIEHQHTLLHQEDLTRIRDCIDALEGQAQTPERDALIWQLRQLDQVVVDAFNQSWGAVKRACKALEEAE